MSLLSFAVVLSLTPGHLVQDELITKSLIFELEGLSWTEFCSNSTDFTNEGIFRIAACIVPFPIPALVHGTTVLIPLSIGLTSSPFGEPVAFGSRIRPYPVAFSSDVRISKPYIVDISK